VTQKQVNNLRMMGKDARDQSHDTIPLIAGYDESIEPASDPLSCADDRDSKRWMSAMSYTCDAFYAISIPVTITAVLASLAAVYLQVENGSKVAYYPISDDDTDPLSMNDHLLESAANAVIIVSVIFLVSLLVVLIYWLGCSKIIVYYLICSSTILLASVGGQFLYTIIVKLGIALDVFTFLFLLHNITMLGVYSIFWSSYVPSAVTKVERVVTYLNT
jgi:hypothetical protein